MKPVSLRSRTPAILSWVIAAILLLLPFHAFLTVWLSSALGHYELLRLWKEFLLVLLMAGIIFLLKDDKALRQRLLSSRLVQAISAYIFITLLWGVVAYSSHQVTLKALGYGLIVNLRFLLFFIATWIVATKSPILHKIWPKILLLPAALVIFVGLLQRFILPYDVLKHFGYEPNTIFPYEDINHNIHYPRIMSTLRGANPLGAYMTLIISCVAAFWLRAKKQRWLWGLFGVGAGAVLVLSYSRGAWAGTLLSLLVLLWVSINNEKYRRIMYVFLGALAVLGAILLLVLRNNSTFDNIVFHTQNGSAIKATSDQGHASAFKSGLHDFVHEPLGRGPGTAGPASIYNNNKPRIAENYYIQIAQEIGWLGLALFLAINYSVARELWLRRKDILASILLASLVGIMAVNLVSHAWTDDTLSYIWWGLAGIALSAYTTNRQNSYVRKNKKQA